MDKVFLVYLICFGVGLLFTIVSAFMADVFGGHDADVGGHEAIGAEGHAEAGFGTHDMPGFSPISPTTIASFVTAFGGIGMVLSKIEATSSVLISGPVSALGGVAIATLVFWLFRAVFRRTQSSSESKVAQVIGLTATVITPIAANGVGEIAYIHGGSRYTAPARSEGGAAFANGQTVKILRIVGTQFYVAAS
ncbi:MAG: NfeD family protein [Verrucomicrobia bacterium]|nr:NfeD family protein [Verrucomicrobiota bacterium]